MSTQGSGAGIGRRSILVAVLVIAAVVGWGIGSLAGRAQQAGPTVPSAQSPIGAATPIPSPTTSMSISAGPNVSAAPLLELSGTGNKTSPDFDVLFGWQIIWQTDGERITIAVKGAEEPRTVVDSPGPASGVNSPTGAGRFHLEVTATGPWSIKVIQGTG